MNGTLAHRRKIYDLTFVIIALLFFTSCKDKPAEQVVTNASPMQAFSGELFQSVPPSQSNITAKNRIMESDAINYYQYEYLYNGGGVAVGDINNDNLPDLFFTINMGLNRLYLNKGNFQFEDISKASNIRTGNDWCTGTTMVDINNDGFLDIYVCRSGWFKEEKPKRNLLYINNGNNSFTEQAAQYGLDDAGNSTQASFFDFDNDGDLDMYLANHPTIFRDELNSFKKKKSNPPASDRDRLYRNDNGRFVDVSDAAGIVNYSHTLGIVTTDLNNDGWTDIYVSNDYQEPDYYYKNNGDGSFTNVADSQLGHMAKFSMGVDANDINNDGALDVLTVEMMAEDNKRQKTNMAPMNPQLFWSFVDAGFGYQFMHNCLQLNDGQGRFSEIAYMANVATTDWSWAPLFADFDNDGWKDLFISNGYKRDILDKDFKKKMEKVVGSKTVKFSEIQQSIPSTKLSNYIFKNEGDLNFSNQSRAWGLSAAVNSNGAAYVDLDNDGDLDLVTNNMEDPIGLYRNQLMEAKANNQHYLKVKAIGPANNKFSIGAKIQVQTKAGTQYQELTLTRGFQSSVEPVVHFGLGTIEEVDELQITWTDGKSLRLTNIKADQTLSVEHSKASASKMKTIEGEKYFQEATKARAVDFTHQEKNYDDYAKQVLLPHKLSQNGAGIAVGDVNADGLEDFYIGGAAGQAGALFLQNENQSFTKKNIFAKEAAYEDMGAILFDADQDGDKDLYVVSGTYEVEEGSPQLQDRLYLNDGNANFTKASNALPVMKTSGSCVIAGDYDQDGDLDLFVGGRVISGKYPYAPQSYLLRNDAGKFSNVTNSLSSGLNKVGMVTSALWTDYDNDQDLDLLVVGEWMPISLFENVDGQLKPAANSELASLTGWWNSVVGADLDNDGDTDYVLGNLGLNSKNKASIERPFEIYGDDFDQNGSYDIVLGYYNGNSGLCYPVRGLQCSSEQMASIAKKIPSYQLFGESTLEQIYGKSALEKALHLKANIFESIALMNDGNGAFRVQVLPRIAQVAPTYGILVEDFDQDGCLDLLTVGNQLPVEVETGQYDAHKGLFLKGDCTGKFAKMDAANAGFYAYGDAKALSMIKLGKANDVGILLSQNNGDLKFFNYLPQTKYDIQLAPENQNFENVKLKNGQTRKLEFYYGSGYLGQSSRMIVNTDLTQ